jgi:mRNA-degrading endonuclease toxin of MazEF toxin-antitoxin module
LNGVIDDTVLVQITSTRHHIPNTEVPIDPAVETNSGLKKPCVVSCPNMVTIDQALVLRVIGSLSDATMQQIEECLRHVLEIQ